MFALGMVARGLVTLAGKVLINKYTATAAAGALAITTGPVFVERGIRGLAAGGEAHKFAKTTYDDYQKLALRDKRSYTLIK